MEFADGDDEDWWQHVPAQTLRAALTLSQTVWWVDSESSPHFVDTMSTAHRDGVIDYLSTHSRSLLLDVQETATRARPGNAAARAAEQLCVDGVDPADSDFWMESTPLMRRLRQLAAGQRPPRSYQ